MPSGYPTVGFSRLPLWLAKPAVAGLPPLGATRLFVRRAVTRNGGIIVQTGGSVTNNSTCAVTSGNTGSASSLPTNASRPTNFSSRLRRRGCAWA